MNLYNEAMCCFCWDIDRLSKPAKWTCVTSSDGKLFSENICDDCKGQFTTPEYIAEMKADIGLDEYEVVEVKPFELNPIPVFVRGDRVDIVRINRPPLTGTVVHCYISMRDFQAKVNVVVDGKKWPKLFPTHIVKKRVIERKVA